MAELERRGGRVVVGAVDVAALDEIAGRHDLTVVATGRADLNRVFELDPVRSVYQRPQRNLCMVLARGRGLGLRVGIKASGCSGYAYLIDYADQPEADEVVFESHGAKVFVARDTLPMLDGLVVDFRKEGLNEVFKFENPNAEALCGCGESFSVQKTAA